MSPQIAQLLEDISDNALAETLRGRGWIVSKKNAYGWETPTEFCRRHGLYNNWLSSRLNRKKELPEFEAEYGGNKRRRLYRLRSNAELEAFVKNRRKFIK